MGAFSHAILGQLDPTEPGFWDATLSFNGRTVTVDLTIDGDDVDVEDLQALPQKPEDLVALDRAARLAITSDAESGDEDSAALLYLTHHESELPAAELQRLFGTDKPGSADAELMLSRLSLVRVGLYPEEDDGRILLDYSIDPDVTQYVLSVSFDASGEPTAVDLES